MQTQPANTRHAYLRQLGGLVATPLASIFGSGFLIIVPVVAAVLGVNTPWGVLAVCLFAWPVGSAVRATIVRVEGRPRAELPRVAVLADRIATPAVILAYVVSVSLYLRVLAAYVFHAVNVSSDAAERTLVITIIVGIILIGVTRGFNGLERVEQWALYGTLAVGGVLLVALTGYLATHWQLVSGSFLSPPSYSVPDPNTLRVLGGVLITVQGFETVRFLGDEYPARIRITASRVSQVVSTIVYVLLALVATPLFIALDISLTGEALLTLMQLILPVLVLPLLFIAVGSQLSAAIADTVAAVDGSDGLSWVTWHKRQLYVAVGCAAILLVLFTTLFQLVTIASQAFALYYGLTSVAAAATATRFGARVGLGLLAAVLFAITVLAIPATG